MLPRLLWSRAPSEPNIMQRAVLSTAENLHLLLLLGGLRLMTSRRTRKPAPSGYQKHMRRANTTLHGRGPQEFSRVAGLDSAWRANLRALPQSRCSSGYRNSFSPQLCCNGHAALGLAAAPPPPRLRPHLCFLSPSVSLVGGVFYSCSGRREGAYNPCPKWARIYRLMVDLRLTHVSHYC